MASVKTPEAWLSAREGEGVDGESVSAFQVLILTALTASPAATCTTASCSNTGTTT